LECKKWVLGGGYCTDHRDLEIERRRDEVSRLSSVMEMAQSHEAQRTTHHSALRHEDTDAAPIASEGDAPSGHLRSQLNAAVAAATASHNSMEMSRMVAAAAAANDADRHSDEMARLASTVSYLSGDGITL
jgi:hypothetical protein